MGGGIGPSGFSRGARKLARTPEVSGKKSNVKHKFAIILSPIDSPLSSRKKLNSDASFFTVCLFQELVFYTNSGATITYKFGDFFRADF